MENVIFTLRTMAHSDPAVQQVFDEIQADWQCSCVLTDRNAFQNLKVCAAYNRHIITSKLPKDVKKQLLFEVPL